MERAKISAEGDAIVALSVAVQRADDDDLETCFAIVRDEHHSLEAEVEELKAALRDVCNDFGGLGVVSNEAWERARGLLGE